ncbi:MAG: type II toxin-antitoxin system mRNA interferase toxin, RelE/StbE family [Rickettsiales bacterium]
MIGSFKHKALEKLYTDDSRRGLPPELVERLQLILSVLAQAKQISELQRPSFRLHPLKGNYKGFWAITVRANWRVVFRFVNETAYEIDFMDYH